MSKSRKNLDIWEELFVDGKRLLHWKCKYNVYVNIFKVNKNFLISFFYIKDREVWEKKY